MRFNLYFAAFTALILLSSGLKPVSYGRFRFNIEDANRPQAWIIVMGLTGAGKSSFIREAVGVDSDNLSEVGHGLEPCTAGVTISPWSWAPTLALFHVDTPGFDDTHREDEEVLTEIASDLAGLYKSGIPIGAVIYLHRISDNKLQRGALRSISILRELVGRDKSPSVIFATTWWDAVKAADNIKRGRAVQARQLLGLIRQRWGHNYTTPRSTNIVDEAIRRTTSEPLKIQKEIVTDGLALKDTSAMLVLESFDFFEKLQNSYAKRKISFTEYMNAISDWMRRKKEADTTFWNKHGADITNLLITVAQTVMMTITGGATGGLEAVVITAIAEAVQYFLAKESTEDSDDSKRRFEL